MGVEYYLITRNKESKKAISVWIGKYYSTDTHHDDVTSFIDTIIDLDNSVSRDQLDDIEDTKLNDIRVGQLHGLMEIKQLVEKIKLLDTHSSGELLPLIKLFGLILGLTEGESDEFEWEVIDDMNIDKSLKEMKNKGYEIIEWN